MSFQGPGTGLTGYGASFTAGAASYTNGNIGGYAPQAGYANQAAAYTNGNIGGNAPNATYAQSAMGSWAWSGQPGTPGWLWGGNAAGQYAVWQPGNITVGTANYTNGNIGGNAPNATYAQTAGIAGSAGNANYANSASSAVYTNGNIGGNAPNATYAYATYQSGVGTGIQLMGGYAFSRAGRSAGGGTYGWFAGYTQQGQFAYANTNTQFGGYWTAFAIPTAYASNQNGNNQVILGQWQGNNTIYMTATQSLNGSFSWTVLG
jgi:hypothetical protein